MFREWFTPWCPVPSDRLQVKLSMMRSLHHSNLRQVHPGWYQLLAPSLAVEFVFSKLFLHLSNYPPTCGAPHAKSPRTFMAALKLTVSRLSWLSIALAVGHATASHPAWEMNGRNSIIEGDLCIYLDIDIDNIYIYTYRNLMKLKYLEVKKGIQYKLQGWLKPMPSWASLLGPSQCSICH